MIIQLEDLSIVDMKLTMSEMNNIYVHVYTTLGVPAPFVSQT